MGFAGTSIPGAFVFNYKLLQKWETGVDGSYDAPTTRAYVFRYPHIGPEPFVHLLFSCFGLGGALKVSVRILYQWFILHVTLILYNSISNVKRYGARVKSATSGYWFVSIHMLKTLIRRQQGYQMKQDGV